MATATAARGPLTFLLQSSSGQYIALGLGVYALFPEQVRKALAPLLGHPALTSQFGQWDENGNLRNGQQYQQQPIIIHTPPSTIIHSGGSSSSGRKSVTTVLIYSVAGAGACWVGYIVCSQLLPDAVSEFMPVTKRLFKTTSETLSKGILQVKDLLEDQIHQLLGQQKALEQRQEDTHKSVKEVQSELGEARLDVLNLQNSLDRCEAGLDHSNNMQGYTLRGIQLLVRCVTSFLPDESSFIEDISHYIEEGGNGNGTANATANSMTRAPDVPQRRFHTNPPPPPNRHGMMSRHTSMPIPLPPNPNKVFGPNNKGNGNNNGNTHHQHVYSHDDMELIGGPSVASLDSLDDLSSKGGADNNSNSNSNYMGDIRALLGH